MPCVHGTVRVSLQSFQCMSLPQAPYLPTILHIFLSVNSLCSITYYHFGLTQSVQFSLEPFLWPPISAFDSTFCYGIIPSSSLPLPTPLLPDSWLSLFFIHLCHRFFCNDLLTCDYYYLLGYATATKPPKF